MQSGDAGDGEFLQPCSAGIESYPSFSLEPPIVAFAGSRSNRNGVAYLFVLLFNRKARK